jgi:hypothetical protein
MSDKPNKFEEVERRLRLEERRLEVEETKARQEREKERHGAGMAHDAKRGERSEVFQSALIQTILEVKPMMAELMQVYKQQLEFGNDNAIRAAACAMIKRAAEEDKPALKEAANQLLDVLNKKA